MPLTVSDLKFAFIPDTQNTYLATWKFNRTNVKEYKIEFWYYTYTTSTKKSSSGKVTKEWVWIRGESTTSTVKQATYAAPDSASKIRVRVKPVSTERKVNGKNQPYWTCEWSSYKVTEVAGYYKPDKPSAPSIEVTGTNKNRVVASLVNNIDDLTDTITFAFYSNNKHFRNIDVKVKNKTASTKVIGCAAGTKWKIKAKAINIVTRTVGSSKKTYKYESDWSEFSDEKVVATAKPVFKKGFPKALSTTSIRLEWNKVNGTDHYEIGYATSLDILKNMSNGYNSVSTEGNLLSYNISNLETGSRYYFRIRSINKDQIASPWSDIVNQVLGTEPSAPTTWSSESVVSIGDKVNLYWLHNTEDGSGQEKSNIQVYSNGSLVLDKEITNDKDKYGEWTNDTNVYSLDTSTFEDSSEITWRVRTKGITGVYGEWSIYRSIKAYEKPQINLQVYDLTEEPSESEIIVSYPVCVSASVTPQTQKAIGFSLSVISMENVEITDEVGNSISINEGDEIYSKYIDADQLSIQLTSGELDLQNGKLYKFVCIASLDSGLTATDERVISPSWIEENYLINGEIMYDENTYSTSITCWCENNSDTDYVFLVNREGEYFADSKDNVLYATLTADNTKYDQVVVPDELGYNLADNVVLSVYRREANGNFIEIDTDIPNTGAYKVIDPHPTLDYARYRIVARSLETGKIEYSDLPSYPIQEKSIIIQWKEEWSNGDSSEDQEDLSWTGEKVILPYNIDIQEQNSLDVALASYIGRSRPVSYYGTQLGENPSWSCEIPKNDTDTLYQLRKLSVYRGDVYVREPSGTGYWAQVSISFNQTHRSSTIPVTINIKPVEGGM